MTVPADDRLASTEDAPRQPVRYEFDEAGSMTVVEASGLRRAASRPADRDGLRVRAMRKLPKSFERHVQRHEMQAGGVASSIGSFALLGHTTGRDRARALQSLRATHSRSASARGQEGYRRASRDTTLDVVVSAITGDVVEASRRSPRGVERVRYDHVSDGDRSWKRRVRIERAAGSGTTAQTMEILFSRIVVDGREVAR